MVAAEQTCALLAGATSGTHAIHLSVLALTHFQLGDTDDASTALAQFRAIMSDPANDIWPQSKDAKALLAEAEALIEPTAEPPGSTDSEP